MKKQVHSDIAQANMQEAERLCARLQLPWFQIWDRVQGFAAWEKDIYSRMLHDLIVAERPFRCVFCRKHLTWMELCYNPYALDDRRYVDTFHCYHDMASKPSDARKHSWQDYRKNRSKKLRRAA